jgi:hypothetical protein
VTNVPPKAFKTDGLGRAADNSRFAPPFFLVSLVSLVVLVLNFFFPHPYADTPRLQRLDDPFDHLLGV